jgi:hypothetical protein
MFANAFLVRISCPNCSHFYTRKRHGSLGSQPLRLGATAG